MEFKKWVVADLDKQLAKELSYECNIDPIVALIASSRGYTDPMELEQFLTDEIVFSDVGNYADIKKAAEILNQSITENEKIAIYGDYDCDGVTATAILYKYLKSRGADCIYYIPDRFDEGYGMNVNAVEKLKEQGTQLIITVDNGINCAQEIEFAKKLDMKVIVTDHHLPKELLPIADAVVDPHRNDCPSEFKEICGAQVVFALICVAEDKEPEELIYEYADILAIGVLADIMPLVNQNRSIVKCGIEKIKKCPSKGLSALLNVAGIDRNSVNSSKLTFGISPRINAAGRMGKADRAVELLITEDIKTAISLAEIVDKENQLRQKTEKEILALAIEEIEKNKFHNDRVIVVSGENWHHGVLGIVASKITERYGVPSILLSTDGEIASGSGRSIDGFSLFDAINYCDDLLIKFGGHSQAAGMTLKDKEIPALREKINLYAKNQPYPIQTIKLDCKLNPAAINLDLCFALKQLEPFGTGNSIPLFGIYNCTLTRITSLSSGKHLKLTFNKDNCDFTALLFGVSLDKFSFNIGDSLDLAVTIDANLFNGNYSVMVQIKEIRPSKINEGELFGQFMALKEFLANEKINKNLLLPQREEVGEIYRQILKDPSTKEKIYYKFISSIGYGKTEIAIMVLNELGLVTIQNSILTANRDAAKTSLDKSKILQIIKEGGI